MVDRAGVKAQLDVLFRATLMIFEVTEEQMRDGTRTEEITDAKKCYYFLGTRRHIREEVIKLTNGIPKNTTYLERQVFDAMRMRDIEFLDKLYTVKYLADTTIRTHSITYHSSDCINLLHLRAHLKALSYSEDMLKTVKDELLKYRT